MAVLQSFYPLSPKTQEWHVSSFSFGLILTAAWVHATWNLLAKRVGGGGLLVWLFNTIGFLCFLPVAIVILTQQENRMDHVDLFFLTGTAILHLVYFLVLQRGYQTGDLSLVYPLARGTGPLLSTLLAILVLKERPTFAGLTGLGCIIGGVFLLTVQTSIKRSKKIQRTLSYGFACGLCISAYSVWDKYAVDEQSIPPVVLEVFSAFGVSFMLTPYAVRNWNQVTKLWQCHHWEILCISILAPLSYILVLTALTFTDLSYIAPAREISIVIGAWMGSYFLGEKERTRRILASVAMVAGLIAMTWG